ncbi:hypothetical protein KL86APRO_11421 [uncultured Alphaproteobacteria bacterium]|uniref:Uncharacterized protein n=1 Tax=uncultured Alphaproteobacteria bacterium TaxID=91750 RepID=A0A212JPK0_9PROT|nr:hypothetical protein KL86APRO_11421 [uncultured Alphaproteobacteria bacterium]
MTAPDFAALIAEARALVAAGDDAAALARIADAADRGDAPPSLLWLAGKLAAENRRIERAIGWLGRAAALAPAAEVVQVDYADVLTRGDRAADAAEALRRAVSTIGPSAALLATSLSPRGGDAQRTAIASWRGFGTRLISVNTAAEIAQLAPEYPDVAFRETARDGRDLIGKPLVYVDDLLDALADEGAPVCGIVNADILLLRAERLAPHVSRDALTLCHRLDLDDPDDPDGRPYVAGFDAFFFPRDWIPVFRDSRLLLGAPWWDYLFAARALLAGLPMRVPRAGAIGHVVHPINWSQRMYVATAALWMEALRRPPAHPLSAPAAFLVALLDGFAARHRLTGEFDEDTLADPDVSAHVTMLLTLVNHLLRTQAQPAADPPR